MKKLLLIAVIMAAATATSVAQIKSGIEIKNLNQELSKKENNEFKIVAHEEVAVNLKFNLKKEDSFNLLITDEHENIVFNKEYSKEGENKIAFTMNEQEQYTVKLTNPKLLTKVIVKTQKN